MSMCRVISCVFGRGCLLWLVCSLAKTLLAFALLHFVLQGQRYLYLCTPRYLLFQVSFDFLLLHFGPIWWKGQLFLVLVLAGHVCLSRTIQLQLLQHYWLGHRLGLMWYWMVCLGNRDHSVIVETGPNYSISDSCVDYEGYCISSKGFLAIVVDIIIIWIKFAVPVHFSSLISKMSMFTLAISCLNTFNLP